MNLEEKMRMLTDPQCFQENRLSPVSDHRWYETTEEAIAGEEMELRVSLNGLWKFHWAANPSAAPEGFERLDYSCKGWQTIPVPGQMELNGYGKPQYSNTAYPWDGRELVKTHEVPLQENPTGCYVKYFTVPETFSGKRLQLHFEGVETAFHCWLNGIYIGYSEDSYTPAIFDVTEAAVLGENKLAVEVYRFSSGSWLEDQDFWRMGGIVREAALTALPEVHIRDLDVAVDVVKDYTEGIAKVRLLLDVETSFKHTLSEKNDSIQIVWKLLDAGQEGKVNYSFEKEHEDSMICTFSVEVPNVQLWSAERPFRYCLIVEVQDAGGRCIEAVSQQIGFRKVEIKDAVLYLNGKRLRLNGVNRHEFSARKGRAIGREEMEWDIRFLKQHNLNAVRTCHYPNQSLWYELCDEYGIYVMDETNLETHGTWHMMQFEHTLPGNLPEWKEACLSRAKAMLERDKNHPCIFSWSVGNESWSGQTLYDMSEYFRKRDASRPVHYENVCHSPEWADTTDLESRMYASPQQAREYLEHAPKKPYVLCEYSHAMGNSCGNLKEYTELLGEFPQYCGGFIWDYIDQTLYRKNVFGEEVLAYGGDFDDRPTDYNFCTNGLIYGDRTISPKAQEVKYLYQPYTLLPEEDGVTVRSHQLFDDGTGLLLKWKAERNGQLLKCGQTAFAIEPGTERKVFCDLAVPEKAGEYVLTASLVLAEDTIWAEAGWELCFGQHVIERGLGEQKEEEQGLKECSLPPIEIIEGDTVFSVKGSDFLIQYQKQSGKLTSLNVAGRELVYDPVNTLLPDYWRAPTDNDEGNGMKERCQFWKTASLYPVAETCSFRQEGNKAVVTVRYRLNETAVCVLEHKISANGTIEVRETLDGCEGLPEMPCFGLTWKLPKAFSNIVWYGKGPEETYTDRCEGGKLGVYKTTPEAGMAGYVVPQECGNHVETRWMMLTDKDGIGIKAAGENLFEFSVLPYTCHELEAARHLYELPRPYATVLRLNQYQTGVGGDNSWGARTHDAYVLKAEGRKEFKLQIQLVRGNR